MRRTHMLLAVAVLVAALGGAAILWATTSSGPPHSATVSALACIDRRTTVSNAAVPAELASALPILSRPRRPADTPPREAIATLSSLATGIELDHAQLVRASAQGGRAWIVPVLHEAPQLTPSIACMQSQITMIKQQARVDAKIELLPRSTKPLAAALRHQRSEIAAARRYQRTHHATQPPGVIVVTQGTIVQGANGTLNTIRAGAAFSTGECAGPGHNLLSVSGLAPSGTTAIELRSPDGASQTQPAGQGAYSFLFAPTPSRAGLPNRLVLLDQHHHALHTLTIPATSFTTRPRCAIGTSQHPAAGPRGFIPAGYTIIAANAHGPGGVGYTIGAASGGAPQCAPEITVQMTNGSSGGGTRYCNLSPTTLTAVPRFTGGGCGANTVELDGAVSSRVTRLRFIAANGRTASTPVFAVPSNIALNYGVVIAIGPAKILATNPTVQSLDADGHVLATSHALHRFTRCGKSSPVQQLPPGTITLAHATTTSGPVAILLHRIRYLGHISLCIGQRPQGNQQCANYPIGPKSNQRIGNAPMWLMDGGYGSCKKPRFQVITAIILRPGLTAWLRTPDGLTRMPRAPVPKAFDEPGPLVYAVLTKTPDTIILQNAHGKTVYSRPALAFAPFGYCGGLNPDTSN